MSELQLNPTVRITMPGCAAFVAFNAPLHKRTQLVGMFEHVGLKNLPVYFSTVQRLLKLAGMFLNHGILHDVEGWKKTPFTQFINRYVFPDCQLDRVSNVQRADGDPAMTLAGKKRLVVGTFERLLDRLGLLGGEWLIHLMVDRGGGRFDSAWLVENFEKLNPANALWSKHCNLSANVDTFCVAVAAADFHAARSAAAPWLGRRQPAAREQRPRKAGGHVT